MIELCRHSSYCAQKFDITTPYQVIVGVISFEDGVNEEKVAVIEVNDDVNEEKCHVIEANDGVNEENCIGVEMNRDNKQENWAVSEVAVGMCKKASEGCKINCVNFQAICKEIVTRLNLIVLKLS